MPVINITAAVGMPVIPTAPVTIDLAVKAVAAEAIAVAAAEAEAPAEKVAKPEAVPLTPEAQAELDAAKAKRAATQARTAAIKRRAACALPIAPDLVFKRLWRSMDLTLLPEESEWPSKARYDAAKKFAEAHGSRSLDTALDGFIKAKPGNSGAAAVRSLLAVYINDSSLRDSVAEALKVKAGAAIVTDAITRQCFRARCAARQPMSSGSGSRFARRLAEMRTAPVAPAKVRRYPAMEKLGLTYVDYNKLDRMAPTFPGITSVLKVRVDSVVRVVMELTEPDAKGAPKKVRKSYDAYSRAVRVMSIGAAGVAKPLFIMRSKREGNIRDDHSLKALSKEYGEAVYCASLLPLFDNGKVKPHEWAWLLRRTLLSGNGFDFYEAVRARTELRISPLWSMMRCVNNAPPVIIQQVASLLVTLRQCGVVDGPEVFTKHMPEQTASTLYKLAAVGESLLPDGLAGVAQPSGLLIPSTPEALLEALKKDPSMTVQASAVTALDVNHTALADEPHKATEIQLPLMDYARKLLGMADAEAKLYVDGTLKQFRNALGLCVIELDPSLHPEIAYHVFRFDSSKASGIWNEQGGDGLPEVPFNRQYAAQSCMRMSDKAQSCTAFYAHQTTCTYLLVVDKAGRVHARAVLWKDCMNAARLPWVPLGADFVDRFYCASAKAGEFLAGYCNERGFYRRNREGYLQSRDGVPSSAVVAAPLFGHSFHEGPINYGSAYLDTMSGGLATESSRVDARLLYAMAYPYDKAACPPGMAVTSVHHGGGAAACVPGRVGKAWTGIDRTTPAGYPLGIDHPVFRQGVTLGGGGGASPAAGLVAGVTKAAKNPMVETFDVLLREDGAWNRHRLTRAELEALYPSSDRLCVRLPISDTPFFGTPEDFHVTPHNQATPKDYLTLPGFPMYDPSLTRVGGKLRHVTRRGLETLSQHYGVYGPEDYVPSGPYGWGGNVSAVQKQLLDMVEDRCGA